MISEQRGSLNFLRNVFSLSAFSKNIGRLTWIIEEDREFMRQCEELAENTQNPADKRRWQQAAASWRRLAGEQGENERQRDRDDQQSEE